MKIFSCEQIREIDRYTVTNDPVASVDLMERAAGQLLKWCLKNIDRSRRIIIIAGPGNNGGDGMALARLLHANRYMAEVCYIGFSERTTEDWNINRKRLESETTVSFRIITDAEQLPFLSSDDIVIDALFGSGLTRPVDGIAASVIRAVNMSECLVISVDIPSGLFGEDNSNNDQETIIRADFTLTFQFPKLSFMFAENAKYTGEWVILPIGLSNQAIRNTNTPYSLLDNEFILPLLRKRNRFDHKGLFGHALLVAGSRGKIGAAVLGARAALRTGVGLLTCHIPASGSAVIHTAVPEAMVRADDSDTHISDIMDIDAFDAIGAGPGIGTGTETEKAFHSLLLSRNKQIIIDADGINILGMNKKWLSALPSGAILTPHIKEFERIAGKTMNSFQRIEKQIELSTKYKCIIVLKGAYTSVSTPDGKLFFNNTGNPGMATAGSGDVLTGMILSLLAQGYLPLHAAVTGVYIHGLAGDLAAARSGYEAVIASDIIDNIGSAFIKIRSAEYFE